MEPQNYNVHFDVFCEHHYVRSFEKKYKKNAWGKTYQDIEDVCRRIDNMLAYKRADLITYVDQYKLVKLDFAVEGTNISSKSSGNRCILFIDESIRQVRILLVYSKNDISGPNETSKWKNIIKAEYPDVAQIFSL